jgi:hypothetical protein
VHSHSEGMAQPAPKFREMDYVKTRGGTAREKATGFIVESSWRNGSWSYRLITVDEDAARAVAKWLPEELLEKAEDVIF